MTAVHTVTLDTTEVVATVGALVEAHRLYTKAHREMREKFPDLPSPYLAMIAYMADAYEILNAELTVPREEELRRVP